jgi:hypothetical protein
MFGSIGIKDKVFSTSFTRVNNVFLDIMIIPAIVRFRFIVVLCAAHRADIHNLLDRHGYLSVVAWRAASSQHRLQGVFSSGRTVAQFTPRGRSEGHVGHDLLAARSLASQSRSRSTRSMSARRGKAFHSSIAPFCRSVSGPFMLQ